MIDAPDGSVDGSGRELLLTPRRVICIIPAYNEGANLPYVLAEVRACCPDLDVLVVDDGSTDGTASLLDTIGNPWLGFPERLGIGNAMRAGFRYAVRHGYEGAVRLDGDGQHRPKDIERMLAPIRAGEADVVLGSRYLSRAGRPADAQARNGAPKVGHLCVRSAQRLLARSLSVLTGRIVSDPTSGFYAVGPRALRLLAVHHPTGYPEPELHLFLSRNRLTTMEVPVRPRARLGGHTSLMPTRWTTAGARVLLALLVVPLRSAVGGQTSD
jgi:glycosyltransferase involved in cell wall biosynthesis